MLEDREFNLEDYDYAHEEQGLPIDNGLWIELKDVLNVPFYIPKKRASPGWPDVLKLKYGIEEYVYYDPEIVGLPFTLSAEQIDRKRRNMNKYLVKSLEDHTPVPPPEKLSAEDALLSIQFEIRGAHAGQEFLKMFGKEEENTKETTEPTEWEKKVLKWSPGYGFLVPYDKMTGFLVRKPIDESSLKYEIVREYFFHVKNSPLSGIMLSVAQEPNTDRAIWGLRRDLRTDWPFDPRFCDGKTTVIDGVFVNGKVMGGIKVNVEQFVEKMNYLVRNLEEILSS